jgi:hypothetical protein
MVVEPSLDNRPQPLAYRRYLVVHQASQPSLDLLQLGSHALGSRFALDRKRPSPCLPALVREAEEGERFWLAQSTLVSAFDREAAELDQAGFVWMQVQAELREAPSEFLKAAFGIGAVLEPHDEIVRVPDDDRIALCVVLSPVLSPQIEYVVEKYIRQER